jgi:anti-anti-sigma regulatory factor
VFKVTRGEKHNGHQVWRLEGRLAEQWVDELSRVLETGRDLSGLVVLDLEGLTYADARGVALLQTLGDRGVHLVGGSAFISTLIARGTP